MWCCCQWEFKKSQLVIYCNKLVVCSNSSPCTQFNFYLIIWLWFVLVMLTKPHMVPFQHSQQPGLDAVKCDTSECHWSHTRINSCFETFCFTSVWAAFVYCSSVFHGSGKRPECTILGLLEYTPLYNNHRGIRIFSMSGITKPRYMENVQKNSTGRHLHFLFLIFYLFLGWTRSRQTFHLEKRRKEGSTFKPL